MSGRRRQQISPTLFPFLAVLVCTLGTLILFLALVAQDSTEKVQRQVEEEAQTQARVAQAEAAKPVVDGLTAQTVDSMIAEEQFRVSQLVSFRDAQAADVEQRRDHLTHLEDHLRRIREELQSLSEEVKRATGEAKPVEMEIADIEALKQRLRDEEKSLVELKEQVQDQTPRIVIVPHRGPNGTDRRPIYLECTEQGLVIWPEGATISMNGLRDAEPGANPLDEALRVARHHILQNYGDSIPPYPLLVVRPDGYASYHRARMAMGDWDDQFGVELIPDEVELAIPNADPNLKKRMDVAISDAIKRQRGVATREQVALGEKRTGKPRTLSAKDLDVQGRASGFESARGVPTSGWDLSNASPYAVDRSRSASQRDAAGWQDQANGPSPSTAISAREMKQLEDEMRASAAELNRGSQGAGGDHANARMLDSDALRGNVSNGDLIAGARGSSTPDSAGSSGGSGALSLGNPATGSPQNGSPQQNSLLSDRSPTGTSAPEETPRLLSPANGAATMGDFMNQSHGDLRAGSPTGTDASDPSQSGSGFAMPESNASESSKFDPVEDATNAKGSSGPTTAGTFASGQASASGAPSSGSSQGSAGASGSSEPPAEGQMGGSPPPQNPNLVRPNKRDWALPDRVAQSRGNSIVRTIRVVCNDSQFVIIGSAMGGATEVFGFSDRSVSQAVLELATAVRDRIEAWGPALPGGRWSPMLDVEVLPGAERRFEQLRESMQGSGVEVVGRVTE